MYDPGRSLIFASIFCKLPHSAVRDVAYLTKPLERLRKLPLHLEGGPALPAAPPARLFTDKLHASSSFFV